MEIGEGLSAWIPVHSEVGRDRLRVPAEMVERISTRPPDSPHAPAPAVRVERAPGSVACVENAVEHSAQAWRDELVTGDGPHRLPAEVQRSVELDGNQLVRPSRGTQQARLRIADDMWPDVSVYAPDLGYPVWPLSLRQVHPRPKKKRPLGSRFRVQRAASPAIRRSFAPVHRRY
jgi:hypothetical protein